MMKKYCVLDQAGPPNTYTRNKELFTTEFSDYYRINYRKLNDKDANIELNFPNLFSEGRCILFEKVPKNYEYYIFIDDDIVFYKKQKTASTLHWVENSPDIPQLISDFFDEYQPMHGTFYRSDDPIQSALPSSLIEKNDVLRITGFDISAVYYHHSFAKLVFPIMAHGFWSIFNFQQWICSKLYPAKLTCLTTVSVRNTNHDNNLGTSYLENQHLGVADLTIAQQLSWHTKPLWSFAKDSIHAVKDFLVAITSKKSSKQYFKKHFNKYSKKPSTGSWYRLDTNSLSTSKKLYLNTINKIATDDSFIKEYSTNTLIIKNNQKAVAQQVSKAPQTASQHDLKRVIDTESDLYQNRASLSASNLKHLKKIKFTRNC